MNPVKRAAPDSNALADLQKRMRCAPNIIREKFLDIFDLLVRDWNRLSAHGDESRDASSKQDRRPHLRRHARVYEKIAGKQRKFDLLAAIAPAVSFRERGEKGRKAVVVQLLSYDSLVPRQCPNGVPIGDRRGEQGLALKIEMRVGTHSFAL